MNINTQRPMINIRPQAAAAAPAKAAAAPAAAQAAAPSESSSLSSVPARIANVSSSAVAEVAAKYGDAEVIPGEMIVKLNPGMENGLMGDFASEYGAKMVEKFDMPQSMFKSFDGDLIRIKLPAGISYQEAVAAMKDDARVAYAEPNLVYTLEDVQQGQDQQGQQPPRDPSSPNDLDEKLWGLNNTGQTGGTAGAHVNAKEAWKIQTGNGSDNGPLIAVIDTGIDYNHPDLQANVWTNPGEIPGDGIDNDNNGVIDDVHGYNAFADNGDPMDGHSHGTHCSGTIAGVGNNGQGVTGVMQDANLMAVKIFSDSGRTSVDAIVRGIAYSAKMGADITSNSWGGGQRSEAIYDAFRTNDALHVIAAGNSNYDNDKRDNFPSNYDLDNIVAVAATTHTDERASFSQWGAKNVDVAAPGKDIYSTVPGNKYASYSGTSMATPHVSGGAGLIMSEYPEASNAEVKARLIHGSDRVSSLNDISVSDGRVNFASSLENDSVAPGAPNDFKAGNLTSRGGTLSWTSVGDDKWANGAAQTIEILTSSEPIDGENIANAQSVTFAGAEEVGDLISVGFGGAPSEQSTTVHFALRSIDNVGNTSEMRTASATIPAAGVAFGDNFDGQSTGFTGTGDFKAVEVEGRGKVFSSASGEGGSKGSSVLTSGSLDLSEKTNSYLKFDAKTALSWGETASVEVSEDGENWTKVGDLGRRSDWSENGIDLSAFDGKSVQLRFNHAAREGRSSGGMMVDNVKVLAD
ncbi:MAG: S8 family serine peptidase [Candidatus Eremiobacteraeota bacterium]|nr:S8 family serine peptidase [Candidatus Eremiobacteraeota bacterium]